MEHFRCGFIYRGMNTEEIWKLYASDVFAFIKSKVKEDALTKDLQQEAFLKLHLKLKDINNQDKIKPYIMQIAHNLVIDYYRKNKKEISLSIDNESNQSYTHSAKDCLLPLIHKLPDLYKTPLLMSEIEGKKQKEVAKKLGISLSAAKSRIQRGRELLKQGFMDCCNYDIDENGKLTGEDRTKEECKVCR